MGGEKEEVAPPRTMLDENIRAVADLERVALEQRNAADRLSDAISRWTGSGRSLILHAVLFAGWMLANMRLVPGLEPFDPYPFSFFTLVVSLEAIFLSIFVLMSQNRMTRLADVRAHIDLQVNMLAEQESTVTLRMLKALCEKHGVDVHIPHERIRQLLADTDLTSLATAVEKGLPDSK